MGNKEIVRDAALYLAEFKEKYVEPIVRQHEKYAMFKDLPEEEQKKAEIIAQKSRFLLNFTASIEKLIEDNVILSDT